MPVDTDVIRIKQLSKSYGASRGVEDVSLTVGRGELFGFIGPNGAGKSTTIRCLLGLLFPDSGEMELFGADAVRQGSELRRRVGFVPSEVEYYSGLKVGGFLDYCASFYGSVDRKRIAGLCDRLKLDVNRRIDDLSLGNRKKVAIVQALAHTPELLILDEASSGLDPLMQSRFYEILREEQDLGCTIFVSSHTLSEVERLCSRVAIIREGRIVANDAISVLRKLSMKRFRLVYSEEQGFDPAELSARIPGVSGIRSMTRGVEGLFSGDIRQLLAALARLPLEDLEIEDPPLEEVFLHYYQEDNA